MILNQPSNAIQTIKLFGPVIMIANICDNFFQHIFWRTNWSQLFLGHVLSSFIINMMIFFLNINKITIPVFFIEKGSFEDLFILRSSSDAFSSCYDFYGIFLLSFIVFIFFYGFTSTLSSGRSSNTVLLIYYFE